MASLYLHTAEALPGDIRLREVVDDTPQIFPEVLSTVIFLYAAQDVRTINIQPTGQPADNMLRATGAPATDILLFPVSDGNFVPGKLLQSADIFLYDPTVLFSPGGDIIIHGIAALEESELLSGILSAKAFISAQILENDLLQGVIKGLANLILSAGEAEDMLGDIAGKNTAAAGITESDLLEALVNGKGYISINISESEVLQSVISGLLAGSAGVTESELLEAFLSGKAITTADLNEIEDLVGDIFGQGKTTGAMPEHEVLDGDITGRILTLGEITENEALQAMIHNGAWMALTTVNGARFAIIHSNAKVFTVVKFPTPLNYEKINTPDNPSPLN